MNAEEIARELCKRVFPSRVIEGLEDYPRMARALTKLPEEIAAALTAARAQAETRIKETEALGIESAQRAFNLRLENNSLRASLAVAKGALRHICNHDAAYAKETANDALAEMEKL